MENLLPVCTGKKLSVLCTKILPVLFWLNISFVYQHTLYRCFYLVSGFTKFHMELERKS